MYLVCIHTILTKTKIIFIAVNASRRGGKTTSHVFVLNITFMIGPVQNMCVCVCAKYDTTIMQDYDYLCTKTDGPTAII